MENILGKHSTFLEWFKYTVKLNKLNTTTMGEIAYIAALNVYEH